MTIRSRIKATFRPTCAVMLASILSFTPGKAAQPLSVKILDASQIRSEVANGNRQYFGVYGDLTINYGEPITIRNRAHPENSISADLRQLSAAESSRVRSSCGREKACDLIITGVLRHGKLWAKHAYFPLDFKTIPSGSPSGPPLGSSLIAPGNFYASETGVSDSCKACSRVLWRVRPAGDEGDDEFSPFGFWLEIVRSKGMSK